MTACQHSCSTYYHFLNSTLPFVAYQTSTPHIHLHRLQFSAMGKCIEQRFSIEPLETFNNWAIAQEECRSEEASLRECFFLLHSIRTVLHETRERQSRKAHGRISVNFPPCKKLMKPAIHINRLKMISRASSTR